MSTSRLQIINASLFKLFIDASIWLFDISRVAWLYLDSFLFLKPLIVACIASSPTETREGKICGRMNKIGGEGKEGKSVIRLEPCWKYESR